MVLTKYLLGQVKEEEVPMLKQHKDKLMEIPLMMVFKVLLNMIGRKRKERTETSLKLEN